MAEQLVGVIEDALLKLKNTIKKDAEVSTCGGTVPQGIPAATSQGTPSTARQQATPSARQQTVFTAGVNRQLDSPRTSNSSGTFNISRLCSQFRGRGLKRKADVSSFTITKLILLNSKDQRYTLKKCELEDHRGAQLVRDLVEFEKSFSFDQIISKIRKLFSPLLDKIDFRILKNENQTLIEPFLEEGVSLTGAKLQSLFYRNTMYIQPSEDLHMIPKKIIDNSRITSYLEDSEEEDFDSPDCQQVIIDASDLYVEEQSIKEKNSDNSGNEPINKNGQELIHVENETTVDTILGFLRSQLSRPEADIVVNRSTLWKDFKRYTGCLRPPDTLGLSEAQKIEFKEEAHDLGGPTREMMTLCLRAIHNSSMFFGETSKYLTLCATSSYSTDDEKNEYLAAGILMAMSFLHGGPGPNFMSDDLYNQIIDGAIKNPQIHHVADPNVRRAILSLSNAKQIEELRNALLDDALVEANLATYATSLGQKDTFVKQALHYFVKVKVTPALQDICNGLESCGLLTIMRSHPNVLKEYFIPLTNPLTPKAFFNIFTIKRETVGSNKFNQESQALSFFSSFLHECEDKKAKCPAIGVEESVTIEDVLFFATGCDRVPPGGFTYPTIKFTHEMDEESDEKKNYPRNLPIANTCVISLYLPVRHTEFEEFRKFMILATNNKNRGFGFA